MSILLKSVLIGIVAGLVDILPMILKKMDNKSIASAFLQYFFVSIVIVNINLPGVVWWLQGGLISFALVLPIAIVISSVDRKAIPIILSMSVILGSLIGLASHLWN